MSDEWRDSHRKAITEFLIYLNKKSDNYVLKGGTSLMLCYNLDRFSEDIDLDAIHGGNSSHKIVTNFCAEKDYTCRVAKDTDTVKRYMLHYGNTEHPLKIEISLRKKAESFNQSELKQINGIKVYSIDTICRMKAIAYSSRDKIRDLYDVAFICNNYWDNLSEATKDIMREAVEHKGIEQFDYMIKTQKDELIDEDKLTDSFLKMYDKLGLLYSEDERALLNEIENDEISQKLECISDTAERITSIMDEHKQERENQQAREFPNKGWER